MSETTAGPAAVATENPYTSMFKNVLVRKSRYDYLKEAQDMLQKHIDTPSLATDASRLELMALLKLACDDYCY